MTERLRARPRRVATVRHDRGNGLSSVAPLAGLTRPTETEPDETPQAFNPGDHTVDDVKSYVDDGHADETQSILDAERAGQARTTLVDWLEARLED